MSGIEIALIIAACALVVAAVAGGLAAYRNAQVLALEKAVDQLMWDVKAERTDKKEMRKEFDERLASVCADYERQIGELKQSYEVRIDDLEAQVTKLQHDNIALKDSVAAYQNAQQAARRK